MIIDFHTHIFPDKVAMKALPKLASVIHLEPSMNGTIDGLKASMDQGNISTSVVLPVVTDVHQFDSILRFASFVNESCTENKDSKIVSLAGMHPASDQYKEQLRLIQREGFKGIKVHPNYQGFHFDDINFLRLLYAASELGLFVITHAGYDPYTPEEEFCSPDMILNVIREVQPPKLILAHLGSNENYDEAEDKLCGQNVYLDTSYSLLHMSEAQLVRMIHKHGADKILFGSDAPWASQKDAANKILSLTGISEKEKQQILYENASLLLGM